MTEIDLIAIRERAERFAGPIANWPSLLDIVERDVPALLAEVARLTEERDRYAAVVAAGRYVSGQESATAFTFAPLTDLDPAATLAARDAEKWAEGHGTGYTYAYVMERESPGDADEFAVTANPYHTQKEASSEQ